MGILDKAKQFLSQIVELGLLFIAIGILLQIIVGTMPGWVFGNVVSNLVVLIDSLGQNGVVGLIAIAIILWLFSRRGTA
jgi:membrane protein DedA with SNARE-associated domain